MSAAPRTARPPATWIGGQPLVQQQGGQGDPDDRLEQHEDPSPRPADTPDPGQEQDRRDRRREQPGEREQRQDRRIAERVGECGSGTGDQRDRDAADHGRGEDDGHRLRGGHGPVAGPADHDEGGLAERCRKGEAEPDRVDPDPGGRIELGRDDRDHPADRQDEGDRPRPVERLAPERDVDARDDDRVGVEAEQREGHRHEVERDEHREIQREPEQRRHQQRQAGLAIEIGEAGPSFRAARDPPGDEGAGRQQPDPAAPGDETAGAPSRRRRRTGTAARACRTARRP